MAEQEDGGEGAYEIPDIKAEIPECLRRLEEAEPKPTLKSHKQMLRLHRHGRFATWIEVLYRLQVLSRFAEQESRNYGEDDRYYDDPPVPSMLIAFESHDGIVRCFDEEAEYWAQGSPEPSLCMKFSPKNEEELARTLRVAYRFFEFNYQLSRLAQDIDKWEARGAHKRGRRRNAEVPAE